MKACVNPDHPKIYHDKKNHYFCPFCKGNPPAPSSERIAKEYGITLHPYQRRILWRDGNRCLVGGRLTGKTTVARIEAIKRAAEGGTLVVDDSSLIIDDRLNEMIRQASMKYLSKKSIIKGRGGNLEKYSSIVIDNAGHFGGDQRLPTERRVLKLLQNFDNVLVVGTPTLKTKSLLEWAYLDPRFYTERVSSYDAPHTDSGLIDAAMQKASPQQKETQYRAQFVIK